MPAPDIHKAIILFVHGFGSSARCWTSLLNRLSADERITSRYELVTWEYPSKWIELNLLGRIPSLKDISRSLREEIDSPKYRGRTLTLVGHSQGGLVIEQYFAELIQNEDAATLRNVQQAILLATPNEGSTTAMSIRHVLSTFFHNPQETMLRVLNPDVADMTALIRERIVEAAHDSKTSWRVPMHAFCGIEDNIVTAPSARGVFDSVKHVPGNHFSIITPRDHQDPRYAELAELLLDPVGHAHRFEIERYETIVRVEPRNNQTIHRDSAKNPGAVTFDNYARMRRTVRFSPSNRCGKPFTIRYGTRNLSGYIVGHTSHVNEASSADTGRGEDTGTYFQFDFTPEPDQDYWLDIEIFDGFDEGDREVHFHLGDHSHYQHMVYVLDLSAFVTAGSQVTHEPRFYLLPEDREHGEICDDRGAREPLPLTSSTPDGVYRWELEDIRAGVVDIVWDAPELDGE